MSPTLLAFWALAGWCGTPWRRWPPPPDPDPWWWMSIILGIFGGIIGGWLFAQIWPVTGIMTGIDVAATGVGAFVGAGVLNNIYAIARMVQARKAHPIVSGSPQS